MAVGGVQGGRGFEDWDVPRPAIAEGGVDGGGWVKFGLCGVRGGAIKPGAGVDVAVGALAEEEVEGVIVEDVAAEDEYAEGEAEFFCFLAGRFVEVGVVAGFLFLVLAGGGGGGGGGCDCWVVFFCLKTIEYQY